jgi:agmatinase
MFRPLPRFLGADIPETSYEQAEVVVLPLPFERTVSYGHGTAGGPEALLVASGYVELYDEEVGLEPCAQGIATVDAFEPDAEDLGAAMDEMEAEARRHMAAGKFVVSLGGEHALTLAPVRAARSVFGEIGVVQFDAHGDLRESYGGTIYSHAAVMRRIVELGIPTLQVGLRAVSTPEAQLVREKNLAVIWGHEVAADERTGSTERFDRLLATLPEQIYLTFDIDFFDPALVPATGTPEPGGGTWYPTLALLRRLFATKTVVAMDVVELAPTEGQPTSDFVAAKLVSKALAYRWLRRSAP